MDIPVESLQSVLDEQFLKKEQFDDFEVLSNRKRRVTRTSRQEKKHEDYKNQEGAAKSLLRRLDSKI